HAARHRDGHPRPSGGDRPHSWSDGGVPRHRDADGLRPAGVPRIQRARPAPRPHAGELTVVAPHSHPKITVIVPARNVADYLAQTLDSVTAQTERDFELLVVDDGSTDG